MGDNSMRTREQVQACLDLIEGERAILIGKTYESDAYKHVSNIARVLRWVLKKENPDGYNP